MKEMHHQSWVCIPGYASSDKDRKFNPKEDMRNHDVLKLRKRISLPYTRKDPREGVVK